MAQNFAKQPNCRVTRICDVDSRALSKCIAAVDEITGQQPAGDKDLRKTFGQKDVDAVVIAMPDHWHAPAALLAMKAGKHVYLEKPCSHTPAEGEMLVEAAKRYKRVVQMGNQRRSWPNIVEAINEIKAGTIGNVYFGKSWYTNNRPSIGTGKETAVPEWLDWELWQGPAPRTAFKDNFIHYNWHWFWRWGTGEALNNGTHMVDLLRWGMELDFPTAVTSTGGRYYYKDDWEAPDTQVINLDFGGKKSMMWEGHCCNPFRIEGEAVGLLFYGEKANLLIGGGNEYKILDHKNQVIKHVTSNIRIDPRNKMNRPSNWTPFISRTSSTASRKGRRSMPTSFPATRARCWYNWGISPNVRPNACWSIRPTAISVTRKLPASIGPVHTKKAGR